MTLESIIKIAIIVHATFGGIALLAGSMAIIAKKGSPFHKKSGKVFHYSMLTSAVMALGIAVMPSHFNPFLFVVGVFTIYLILTGYSALNFKRAKTQSDLKWVKLISYIMLLTGLGMSIVGVINLNGNNGMYIVLFIFGLIATLNATQDLRIYKDLKKLKKKWLTMHIGKMTGGYLAAVTAFIVVNQWIPGVIGWLAPTVLGTFYIIYWTRKVTPKKKVTVES